MTSAKRRARVRAPELTGRGWLNTGGRDVRLKDLRGKIVLLDFWTFCCINCLHVLDELRPLEEEFDDVLVTIGVHSPKFVHEADADALKAAVERYEVHHPVLDDPEMTSWQNYAVKAWPTLVLIDPEGYVVHVAAGEGHAAALTTVIRELVEEHDAKGTLHRGDGPYVPPEPEATDLRFPAKVVVTSRHQYFATDQAVRNALGDEVHRMQGSRIIRLFPLQPAQRRDLVVRTFDDRSAADEFIEAIRGVPNLLDLATNPRMLAFMIRWYREGILTRSTLAANSGAQMTAGALYSLLLTTWLAHEVSRQLLVGGLPPLSVEQRMDALRETAMRMWRSGQRSLSLADLGSVADRISDLARLEMRPGEAVQAVGSSNSVDNARAIPSVISETVFGVAETVFAVIVMVELASANASRVARRALVRMRFLTSLGRGRLERPARPETWQRTERVYFLQWEKVNWWDTTSMRIAFAADDSNETTKAVLAYLDSDHSV
ncbi:thioredoxin-like domain-containing protein, partial [Kibdelosporangium lantanae]